MQQGTPLAQQIVTLLRLQARCTAVWRCSFARSRSGTAFNRERAAAQAAQRPQPLQPLAGQACAACWATMHPCTVCATPGPPRCNWWWRRYRRSQAQASGQDAGLAADFLACVQCGF